MSATGKIRSLLRRIKSALRMHDFEEYRSDFEKEHQNLCLKIDEDGLYADPSVQAAWVDFAEYKHWEEMQW